MGEKRLMQKIEGKELSFLFNLLKEEISQYDGLIKNLKKESDCLKKGLTNELINTLGSIDEQIKKIQDIEKKIIEVIKKMIQRKDMNTEEINLSDLYPLLSNEDQIFIRNFQKKLQHMKDMIKRINERNKWYASESLSILSEIISFFINPPSGQLLYNPPQICKPVEFSSKGINYEV